MMLSEGRPGIDSVFSLYEGKIWTRTCSSEPRSEVFSVM